ncbi:hypothetical protein [Desulfovibrio sp. SGI.169]|uniref:hypothetical protein n=1 Tax=Desulfovibrio sp. SGI.169 TaxID=3420561 RepID=UPI003CFE2D8D
MNNATRRAAQTRPAVNYLAYDGYHVTMPVPRYVRVFSKNQEERNFTQTLQNPAPKFYLCALYHSHVLKGWITTLVATKHERRRL